MPISVVMPALEMAQETGTLIAWRKKEGESVRKGELLLDIETDKAVMEIESPGDGVLAGVRAQEGAVVPVGQTIAWIVGPGETLPTDDPSVQSGRKLAPVSAAASSIEVQLPEPKKTEGVAKLSPKARRLAREHGIDVTSLHGSGPDGTIVAEDVLARVGSGISGNAHEQVPLSTVARLMAERTTRSWTTVPHFFVTREVDAGALIAARERLASAIAEAHQGLRLTYTDLLVFLTSRALVQHPRINATWTGASIRDNPEIHIALAIAVDEGVVGAVIHNADKVSLSQIALQRRDLSERAHAGRLRPADIADATFTISNLGMFEVDAFQAIITPPQAAVLAVGRIGERVAAAQGAPVVRPMMSMTVSCDHRVADGARAARFLGELARIIQEPGNMLG
jgi:pyruvate dehydrogenase E2 component (dihydrolipoamide acetyltransferase)